MELENKSYKSYMRSFSWRVSLVAWGPVALWMAAIFFLSAQTVLGGMDGPPPFKLLRKSGHIVEYAVLGLLCGRALISTWQAQGQNLSHTLMARAWWFGVNFVTLYALTDEFHQSFVPHREAHVEDVIIDTLSATAALGIWYIIRTRKRRTMTRKT